MDVWTGGSNCPHVPPFLPTRGRRPTDAVNPATQFGSSMHCAANAKGTRLNCREGSGCGRLPGSGSSTTRGIGKNRPAARFRGASIRGPVEN